MGIHLLDRIGTLLRSALPGEQVRGEPDEARSGHAPGAINMFHKAPVLMDNDNLRQVLRVRRFG